MSIIRQEINMYFDVEPLNRIGHTPIKELVELEKKFNLKAKIYAKLESFNPGGSIKDRIALAMIKDAYNKGLINKDTVIVEPTSGNTGIGLALVAKTLGLRIIITMPSSMSIERREILKSYGAELVLTDASLGMKGAIARANELAKEVNNSFIPSQFTNPSNPRVHYETTAREIYDELNGKVDILVAGVGTGGTISGVGKYLKEKNPSTYVVAVEPASSPVLSKGISGPHKIQGIGAGFVPETLDTSIYDEVTPISNEDAFKYGRMVNEVENVSAGISSGAALASAINFALKEENKGKVIVVIFPDGKEKYLSTPMFE